MAKTQKNKHKSRIRQRKSRRELGSRPYKNYSDEMLMLACEAVQSGQITSRDAERQFGIPRRTIVNKTKRVHIKTVGHPTALTSEEEDKIVKVLQISSSFGSPLTKLDLKLLVFEYLKKNSRENTFKNKIPGDAWVQSFLARHADELTLRTTQNIPKARAENGVQEIVEYFNNLSETLKDIPAENIVNFDETNLSDDPGSSKGIFRRGVKYPERIVNSTKGNISVMFTATASGKCLPLYVVYKATSLFSEWVIGGPPKTRYNCTKSGWFDSAMFENYFETIILPWARETVGTKVIICDNLSSHLSIKVVELCEQQNIKFVFLPPRSTHLTQPLDIAFFGPLKRCWRKILYQYKLKNPTQTSLNKKHFPKLLCELIEAIQMTETVNIISGFRASGVFPLNPQQVLKKIPEIQQEILSNGLDQVLVDYLKETRSKNPMQIRRNKKIHCEPGKSVTVSDLNIDNCNNKAKKKSSITINKQKKNDKTYYLDERTGLFITETATQSCSKNDINYKQEDTFNISLPQNRNIFIPETLSKQCINIINSCLGQSFYFETANKNKIIILSDVLLKAATSVTNVSLLKEVTNTIENKPFTAIYKTDLPECLQGNKKPTKIINKVTTNKKKEINRQKVAKNKSKVKNAAHGRFSVKRRTKRCDSESSSISVDNEVVIADTDESDYETMNDYYIAECLREQEDKENFELKNTIIPFGLHEIEYFSENKKKLKENDWIVAQFATKKSLKHFVGKVLAVSGETPTVNFLRKVKESKCDTGTTFTYPTVEDICTMQHLNDVITVLPEPMITRRGQIVFNVDFSNFNIQ